MIDEDDDITEISYQVRPGTELEGKITFDNYGPAAQGRWASHTGYFSMAGSYMAWDEEAGRMINTCEPSQALADEIALTLYKQHAAYAFLVWEEYKGHGWKAINEDTKNYNIQLPQWHTWQLANVLIEFGFRADERRGGQGRFWIPKDEVSKEDLRKLLKPAMQPHTRLGNPAVLADEVARISRRLRAERVAERSQMAMF